MRKIVSFAPVLLLSFLAGCNDSTAPVSLTLNRTRWEKQNLHEYSYTGRRSCFCPESGTEVNVLVLADTVFSVSVVGTNVEVQKDAWLTVDQLFDFAEHQFRTDDQTVKIEYDQTRGYPTLIDIGCAPTILDCGLRIEAKNLGGIFRID